MKCSYCGSEVAAPIPCSACQGTGKPPRGGDGCQCVCNGEGTHEAEIRGLRLGVVQLFRDLEKIQEFIRGIGYVCLRPEDVVPALRKMHKRAEELEAEYLLVKKQLRNQR